MQGEIAYILKGFPRLSETFISNEIRLLESFGLRLYLFSIKQGEEEQVHEGVSQIRAPLTVLPPMTSLSSTTLWSWLKDNLPVCCRDHLRLFRRRPLPYLATLTKALWWSLRYRKSTFGGLRKVFIKEFLQAGIIALEVIESESIRHLHAHFCHGATTVALFVSSMSGRSFSFTAHAKDIYQKDQNPGDLLGLKIRQARFVTTCTGANLKYLRSLTERDSIHLVYHGLDIEQFRPAPEARQNPIVQIIAVGRFVEKKGFHYLVEACHDLKQKGLAFHCRILGEYGEGYQGIRELVDELELHNQISLQGPVTHEALADIYRQMDIFALPCQVLDNGDRDGIPNVLMEAMASGLAVVASRISGIPELIDHDRDGLLVAEKNVDALTEALETLFADAAKRHELGDNARNKVCREFDARSTNLRLKQLFTECMDADFYEMSSSVHPG